MKKKILAALLVLVLSAGGLLPILALNAQALVSWNLHRATLSLKIAWTAVLQELLIRKIYFVLLAILASLLFFSLIRRFFLLKRQEQSPERRQKVRDLTDHYER